MSCSKYFWFTVIGMTMIQPAYSANPSPVECPDSSMGETAEDCPWAGMTRQLLKESPQKRSDPTLLESTIPDFVHALRRDSKNEMTKKLWGRSINFDEYAKSIIVDPEILSGLGKIFGVEASGRVVHAGLEHTYGYLLSVLKTPFGFKRARWVRATMEKGFGVPAQLLSPSPPQGGFLTNVTYFLGRIAFRSDPQKLKQLAHPEQAGVPQALVQYHYEKLAITRLTETVKIPDQKGKSRTVTLRTDLVPFLSIPSGQTNSHLLIYSVAETQGNAPDESHLITAFPVEKSFLEKILNPADLGSGRPIVTRYNAYVEGISNRPKGEELKGDRQVLNHEKAIH